MRFTTGYKAYLNSPEWAELRKLKLEQNGYRCQGCGDDERLEVHHLSYARLGNERPEELMVLCHWCHTLEHGRSPRGAGDVAGPTAAEIHATARERDLEREQVVKVLRQLRYRKVRDKIRKRENRSPEKTARLRRAQHRANLDRSSPFRYV